MPGLVSSVNLVVRLQPLFAIGSEICAQLIAFLDELIWMGVHPGDLFDGPSCWGWPLPQPFLRGCKRLSNVCTGTRPTAPHGYHCCGI